MSSALDKFLNGKFNTFNNLKQIGPKSWLISDQNGKTYVLNRYRSDNKKAENSYIINDILFKNPNNNYKTNFLFYDDRRLIDDFQFILIEYCREGDLNKFLLDSRYRRQDNDEQIKNWILQLLRAVEFLNKNRIIHKKLTTYTIMVHNGQLKIDGFEHAEIVDGDSSIVNVSFDENYGAFNSPEIVKMGKINFKYHIWCVGWLIYEICTCEWKHPRLYSEKFDNWKPPNLPENYSKSLNYIFKKMIKLSPASRSKPEKLIKLASDYFSKEKIVRKKSDEVSDSLSFKESLLKSFDQRFERNFDNRDDDEYLSDSDEESSASKSDQELDISEKFKEKNKIYKGKFNDYKVKEILESNEFYSEFLTTTKTRRRRLLRVVNYSNSNLVKNDLNLLRDVLRRIKEDKNSFVVSIDEFFDIGNSTKLGYSSEVFEEGSLDKMLFRLNEDKRNLSEDKIFDYIFYLFDALSFLHEKKIIHRDVRPRNIYLRNEKLKLGNFGIDHVLQNEIQKIDKKENSTRPCYFSPEFVVNKKADARCDVWSAGCVMYEMFKLEPLFTNKSLIKIIETEEITLPEIECRKKTKNLFYTLIRPLNERPNSQEILKKLDEMVKKERETFEKPTSYFDSD
ncbi:unnamed protein product [Brachionus calyciflorus]|uniref:Protein kinase domain-containing protein n=1 Tax=Brachionus calyciflorus TaxID=104777 RepID=A0A813ZQ92_9BILA|nr:unnamed protein product [Brachionus calyciflorus]